MGEQTSRHLLWRPSFAADLARYGCAAVVVVSAASAATLVFSRSPGSEYASPADDAVLLDLPPALASSAPLSEAADGPQQQAMEAAAPVAPPKEVVPQPKPDETPPQEEPPKPEDPPPVEPKPDVAVPQAKPPVESPPDASPPVAASAAQEETAPTGAQTPAKDAEAIDSEAARHRAARALSRWQQAMLVRLASAKRGANAGGEAGTVQIAFKVDRHGGLASSSIVHSSGSARLDREALAILRRAAPFPDPPAGAGDLLSFSVPIAFVQRR